MTAVWVGAAFTNQRAQAQAGSSTVLARDEGGPADVVVDERFVYWANYIDSKIRRVPKQGGPAQLLHTGLRIGTRQLTLGGGYLYFTDPREPGGPPVIKRIAANGRGALETVTEAQLDPRSLTIAGGALFWTTGTALAAGNLMKLDLRSRRVTALLEGRRGLGDVAVDSQHAYVTVAGQQGANGQVLRVPRAGGPASVLVEGLGEPKAIWVDRQFVYFSERVGQSRDVRVGVLKRVSKSQGSPTLLASGLYPIIELAGDASNLYWCSAFEQAVLRLPKRGGSPTVLASAQPLVNAIAIDARYVYWVNLSTPNGGVFATAH